MTYKIVEKLLVVEGSSEWGNVPGAPTTCWHRNPDGPEAAAHIEALAGLLVVARRYDLPTSLERSIDTTLSNLRGDGQ